MSGPRDSPAMVAIGSGVKSCLSEFLSQLVRSKILIAELAYVASRLLGDVLGWRSAKEPPSTLNAFRPKRYDSSFT